MADERTRIRAERLRILLLALGEEPTMTIEDAFAVRLVPRGSHDVMSDDALARVLHRVPAGALGSKG